MAAAARAVRCTICRAVSADCVSCPHCPRFVCVACYRHALQQDRYNKPFFLLPIVRCPLCASPLSKKVWSKHATEEFVLSFERLCALSCEVLSPCCRDQRYQYTHLPQPYAGKPPPLEDMVGTVDTAPVIAPLIRRRLKQFTCREIGARSVVAFLSTLPEAQTLLSREELLDELLLRIQDDERRATLLFAYTAVYKKISTRCCKKEMCFVCERVWADHSDDPTDPCDEREALSNQVLPCRSCGVTLVEPGRRANEPARRANVTCVCGVRMVWYDEQSLASRYARKLIPINIRDATVYTVWRHWHSRMKEITGSGFQREYAKWRRRQVDRGIQLHRRALLKLLQTFLWPHRFHDQLSVMEDQIREARLELLTTKLRDQGGLGRASVRWQPYLIWRRRLRMRLPALKREIHTARLCLLASALKRHGALRRAAVLKLPHTRRRLHLREIRHVVPLYDEEHCPCSLELFDWE